MFRPVVTCIILTSLTAAHAIVIHTQHFNKLLLTPFAENADGVYSYNRTTDGTNSHISHSDRKPGPLLG
jgi:hypothetical protein